MRRDWFDHGSSLIKPLVVKSLQTGQQPITYLEGELQAVLTKMSREDLEVMATCAVMFACAGAADTLKLRKQ